MIFCRKKPGVVAHRFFFGVRCYRGLMGCAIPTGHRYILWQVRSHQTKHPTWCQNGVGFFGKSFFHSGNRKNESVWTADCLNSRLFFRGHAIFSKSLSLPSWPRVGFLTGAHHTVPAVLTGKRTHIPWPAFPGLQRFRLKGKHTPISDHSDLFFPVQIQAEFSDHPRVAGSIVWPHRHTVVPAAVYGQFPGY